MMLLAASDLTLRVALYWLLRAAFDLKLKAAFDWKKKVAFDYGSMGHGEFKGGTKI